MAREPVAIISAIAAVIVFVALKFGFDVDVTTVEALITSAVTIIGGLLARSQVTPVVNR